MKELIKRVIARKLGLITEAQCLALVKKNLSDFRQQANHVTDIMNMERQTLFRENKQLRDEVAELRAVMAHQGVKYPGIPRDNVEEITSFSHPTVKTLEDI